MKIILGDFNAQVGTDNIAWEETMRKDAIGERNDNGERLLSYCSSNKFKIGGVFFNTKVFMLAHGDHRIINTAKDFKGFRRGSKKEMCMDH